MDDFTALLAKAVTQLPGPVRWRAKNALRNFERSEALLPRDREMASFRAITGQEEAAAALIKALQLRDYPGAGKISVRSHQHKAALLLFIKAVERALSAGFSELQATLDASKPRIDVKVSFAALGLADPLPRPVALQAVEPLGLLMRKPGRDGAEIVDTFGEQIHSLVEGTEHRDIQALIREEANVRNRLLYASDSGLPISRFTSEGLMKRRSNGVLMISLALIVLQTPERQPLALQTLEGFLTLIDRLPEDPFQYPEPKPVEVEIRKGTGGRGATITMAR